ncbi:MAG TPA: hypothetical protein VF544_21035 [Pyrinomonadaceae bacterium]|jgi:hypothetical protein
MPEQEDFDLESFQAIVLERVASLQKLGDEVEPFYARFPYPDTKKLKAENPGCLGWIPVGLLMFQAGVSRRTARGLKKSREELTRRAEELTRQREVKLRLCSALKNLEDDPFEIARATTPVLVTLSRTKLVSLDLDANLFATLAIMIASTGIANFCADQNI